MSLATIYREECEQAGVAEEYGRLVAAGNTPQFAAMLAMRRPPGVAGSDRGFMHDSEVRSHGLQLYPERMRNHMVEQAVRAGIPIAGKVYKSGLADQRGPADPRAWVGGLDDVLSVCRERNLNCTGAVKHKGYVPDPEPDCPLSEDLIQESVPEFLHEHPEFRKKPDQLRDAIIEKHGAPATKKPPKKTKKPGGGPAG